MNKEDNDKTNSPEDLFSDPENNNQSQKRPNQGSQSGSSFSTAFETGKKTGNFPGATQEASSRSQNAGNTGNAGNAGEGSMGEKEPGFNETLSKDQAELAKALEDAKSKSEENWNLFLRTRADMDNYRRRSEIDIENARKYAIERFAKELLSVVDSLEHGLSVAESEHDSAYREGMTLTLKLLMDIFDKFGIHEINPKAGEPFDPNRHEAISMQPSHDYEPNRILMVAQRGFVLQDRLLRPARVIVSKSASG